MCTYFTPKQLLYQKIHALVKYGLSDAYIEAKLYNGTVSMSDLNKLIAEVRQERKEIDNS